MKSICAIVACFCFGLLSSQENFVSNHLVIKFTDRAYSRLTIDLPGKHFGADKVDALCDQLAISRIQPIGPTNKTMTFLLEFDSPINVETAVMLFRQTGLLTYAEPDYMASGAGKCWTAYEPTDPMFIRQWGLLNNGTMTGIGNVTADADVDMDAAWDIQTGDPQMVIAIPDSGLRMIHPDIASRIWINENEIAGNGLDDDSNGYVDDMNGWDFVNLDNLPADDLGHGTNVIGIIGAVANNDILYTGVNWNSKVMPLKVLDNNNSGSYANMAAAIYYAVQNGAKIISMSIGGTANSQIMTDALSFANDNNVLFLACMMNTDNSTSYYPARYSLTFPNVIAVGSTNPDDSRTSPFFWSASSGSNFGTHLNVVAPGNFIYGLDAFSDTNANSYWGGTSQATPLVAGVASLLWAQNPSLTPLEIRTILEDTAEDQVGNSSEDTPGFDQYMGHGRINAFAALQTLSTPEIGQYGQEFHVLNPVDGNLLQIFCKGQHEGKYTMAIHNIDGKLLSLSQINITQGANSIPFGYAKGSYIVSLSRDDYTKIFKVLKN